MRLFCRNASFRNCKNIVRNSPNLRLISIKRQSLDRRTRDAIRRGYHNGIENPSKKPIGESESIHNTVQFSPVTNANHTLDLADRPIFSVVIIYEDSAAGKWAKHFYDRVIRELIDECDFSLELWGFQVLAVPEIGNSAAKAAAQADIVILSMHRKTQLSVQTRDWIERWSGLIGDDRSALVALLDQPGMSRSTAASTLDYLRKVADRKGISFYTPHYFRSFKKLERTRLCLHGLTVRKRTRCLIFRRPAP